MATQSPRREKVKIAWQRRETKVDIRNAFSFVLERIICRGVSTSGIRDLWKKNTRGRSSSQLRWSCKKNLALRIFVLLTCVQRNSLPRDTFPARFISIFSG